MSTKGVQVLVKFPPEVTSADQGACLLAFEKHLRGRTKLDVRVVKDLMADDSKLRRMMTPQQREQL